MYLEIARFYTGSDSNPVSSNCYKRQEHRNCIVLYGSCKVVFVFLNVRGRKNSINAEKNFLQSDKVILVYSDIWPSL